MTVFPLDPDRNRATCATAVLVSVPIVVAITWLSAFALITIAYDRYFVLQPATLALIPAFASGWYQYSRAPKELTDRVCSDPQDFLLRFLTIRPRRMLFWTILYLFLYHVTWDWLPVATKRSLGAVDFQMYRPFVPLVLFLMGFAALVVYANVVGPMTRGEPLRGEQIGSMDSAAQRAQSRVADEVARLHEKAQTLGIRALSNAEIEFLRFCYAEEVSN